MMTAREIDIQKGIVDILISQLNPDKIILFGSRGKGLNKTAADFDIAVSGTKPDIVIQQRTNELLEKISGLYKIDIVYLGDVETTFKEIILTTGKVLYEKRT